MTADLPLHCLSPDVEADIDMATVEGSEERRDAAMTEVNRSGLTNMSDSD